MAETRDLTIQQGKTLTLVLRWERDPIVRKPITAVSFASGAPRLTVAAHECPDGWRAFVAMVKGPTELNAKNNPPRGTDYYTVTTVDADTVEFNALTPVDSGGRVWADYVSGGFLAYNTPVALAGYTARMKIKDRVGGTVLASTEAGDTPLNVLAVAVNDTLKTITLSITALATEGFAWGKGVYDLEMVSAGGAVTALLSGRVTVTKEVTT